LEKVMILKMKFWKGIGRLWNKGIGRLS